MLRLLTLTLKNFKGIRAFALNTDGCNVSIFADNAIGKTTIYDSFTWLLYDKDSGNKKDFGIKTLDADNNEIHHLEHDVEGSFDINGRTVTLRKVLTEKWTKKRGSASSSFTGHTTEYFINGVPSPKRDYDAKINEIASEDIFKLLTNPAYFCETLHWQKRRELLLEICGDVSDDEVIASDKELAKLPEILNGRTLDEHRKVIVARRTKINEELQKIPVRIDEVRRGLPDITNMDKDALMAEITALKEQRQDKEQELSRIKNGGEVAEQQRLLREIETKLLDILNKHRSETSDKVYYKKNELQKVQFKITGIDGEINSKTRNITLNDDKIKQFETDCQALREVYGVEYAKKFEYADDDTCPTCGQSLLAENVKAARDAARSKFNLSRAENLEAINRQGKALVAKIPELQELSAYIQKDIDNLLKEKEALRQTVSVLEMEIAKLSEVPDITTNPEYAKLAQEKADIKDRITCLDSERQTIVDEVSGKIITLQGDIMTHEASLVQFDQYDKGIKRIDELAAEEKKLAAEFEKLESELYLSEQFIRAKVNMLENRINSKFKMTRFKLFEVQINSGLAECCTATFNGVPYPDLNNAARINVGLDVINTLSKHYGFSPVIFVDNAEAINELIPVNGQLIRLVVSHDKELRVVIDSENKLMEAV